MAWHPGETFKFTAGGATLEGRTLGPAPGNAPTLVLLHEGLGSLGLWRDFPDLLAEATGCGVFAYSRRGYGRSDPVEVPRPLDYMTREAHDVLPDVLDAIGFRHGVLVGHSDGASIAALYAGGVQDHRVRGVVLMAPHFFTEAEGLASIAKTREAYETGNLRKRMAKHHDDVDGAFWGWNKAWLDPSFEAWNIEEAIAYIRVPVLAIQGRDDKYGTLAQIRALENGLYSPLDVEIFASCGHSPFIDQPEWTLAAIRDFTARLERIEAAQVEMA